MCLSAFKHTVACFASIKFSKWKWIRGPNREFLFKSKSIKSTMFWRKVAAVGQKMVTMRVLFKCARLEFEFYWMKKERKKSICFQIKIYWNRKKKIDKNAHWNVLNCDRISIWNGTSSNVEHPTVLKTYRNRQTVGPHAWNEISASNNEYNDKYRFLSLNDHLNGFYHERLQNCWAICGRYVALYHCWLFYGRDLVALNHSIEPVRMICTGAE